jgi:hypothetical protein
MDGKLNRPWGWQNLQRTKSQSFVCGYCSNQVASVEGRDANSGATIRICPECSFPTFFGAGPEGLISLVVPRPLPGRAISRLPDSIAALYEEARRSVGVGAYTASVLVCRKMLVDLAVEQGDDYKRGKHFVEYVNYLAAHIFTPPHGKDWLDRIKDQGNKATHELGAQTEADAILLITFVEMILRILYEFPEMLAASTMDSAPLDREPVRGNPPGPKPVGRADGGARDFGHGW